MSRFGIGEISPMRGVFVIGLATALVCSQANAEPKVGDQWVYEETDEITGAKWEIMTTVTEVTSKEIVVRTSSSIGGTYGSWVYDHDWNTLEGNGWKYSPHEGDGVQRPLATGLHWAYEIEAQYGAGSTSKMTASAQVADIQKVSTKAGIFEAFVITMSRESSAGPNTYTASRIVWFCPKVDHWVKSVFELRVNGRLQQRQTEQLVRFGNRYPERASSNSQAKLEN